MAVLPAIVAQGGLSIEVRGIALSKLPGWTERLDSFKDKADLPPFEAAAIHREFRETSGVSKDRVAVCAEHRLVDAMAIVLTELHGDGAKDVVCRILMVGKEMALGSGE